MDIANQQVLSGAPYDSHRNSSSNETTLQPHQPEMRGGQVGPAAATNLPTLCLRCRRLATDQSDAFSLELSGVRRIEPNDTSDAEMILVTQAAAAALTKILQNLNAVMSCVPNGVKNVRNTATDSLIILFRSTCGSFGGPLLTG